MRSFSSSLESISTAGGEFVLSIAAGYSPDMLRPLIHSLHRATETARLILLVDSAKQYIDAFPSADRAHFVEEKALRWSHLYRKKWRTWNALLELSLKSGILTSGGGAWARERLLHPLQSRYFIFNRILRELSDSALCLWVDSRDVVFQRNPFDQLADGRFHTGAESVTFRDSPWNAFNLAKTCSDLTEFENIYKEKVLCAGVSGANTSLFTGYIEDMCRAMIERITSMCRNPPSDQPLHNILLRRRKHLMVNEHGGDWLATFGNGELTGCVHSAGQEVLSRNGKPISILHQYDRVPELATELPSRFQNLST